MLINPKRHALGGRSQGSRKKQPYLVNPVNPWRKITVPKHRFSIFKDAKSGQFSKPPTWALNRKPKIKKLKLSRKSKIVHKHLLAKRHIKKISALKPLNLKAMKRQFIKLSPHKVKSHKGVIHMKHRKSHRKSHRRTRHNPFSLKGMAKGFADTGMLIDGSLVIGGMIGTTIGMDFAASKIAFLSTPIGKGLGKLGLAFLVKTGGKYLKIQPRYTNMVALGVIVSAVKDVAEIVLPKIGYTGGVKLLGLASGYSPETSQGLASTGYSPDLAAGGEAEESAYAFSD